MDAITWVAVGWAVFSSIVSLALLGNILSQNKQLRDDNEELRERCRRQCGASDA